MVKTLNITLDDEDYQRAKRIKNELGLTWQGFILTASDELEESQADGE